MAVNNPNMPVYPLRASQSGHGSQYSPYSPSRLVSRVKSRHFLLLLVSSWPWRHFPNIRFESNPKYDVRSFVCSWFVFARVINRLNFPREGGGRGIIDHHQQNTKLSIKESHEKEIKFYFSFSMLWKFGGKNLLNDILKLYLEGAKLSTNILDTRKNESLNREFARAPAPMIL